MSRWRDLASKLRDEGGGDNRDNRDNSPSLPPNVPNVSIVPAVPSHPSAWTSALRSVDRCSPGWGLHPDRWVQLVDDARWLASAHGKAAAALGWTASDLFGIEPGRDGWGGLADRLEGARSIKLTANLAQWRGDECVGWLWRQSLTDKPVLWQVNLSHVADGN